ncbi:hypothetical protein D6C00_06660 [Thiohalobacter thiocyanaticus]|uniref:Bacterial type II secretion system protein E domain-containing protein n=1 Tax=Thiohalobacter thiocyanaticus TaxID=585455 RepID=A0A426QIS3_9GAMM|nr:hypothetical protein D6C00_06660 [Thiohalobacter thiocyanaticus]
MVLSTLHTNDAPTTVMRLIEMGVESFLVKSSLLGVLAQRLVRINCPHCIEPEPVDATMRRFLGVAEDEVFHHGAGCETCNQDRLSRPHGGLRAPGDDARAARYPAPRRLRRRGARTRPGRGHGGADRECAQAGAGA